MKMICGFWVLGLGFTMTALEGVTVFHEIAVLTVEVMRRKTWFGLSFTSEHLQQFIC